MVEQDPEEILPPVLPARPPTPPRRENRQQEQAPTTGFHRQKIALSRSSSASNFTPNSSFESPNQAATRKKVGFSDSTQYSDPPTVSFDGKALTRVVAPLPPSAERKPSKSILKAYKNEDEMTTSRKLLPPHQHESFAKMLESIVQHLSKGDRNNKVDGYLTLSGALKASDNVPDLKALKDKAGLLCQFIARDLTDTSNDKPDFGLMVHALTLLSCLMFKQAVPEYIPVDFQILFVDHAIKVFAEGGTSKEVTRHLLLAMAQQNFSAKVMNSERVGRLINVLHKVEKHFGGKSIVQGRTQIYRTLIRQSKSHMLTHTLWVNDLVTDMLSSIKEVRQLAINFGLESSFALGTEKGPSNALNSLLRAETEDKVTYADFYVNRLKAMIKKKEDAVSVPQIWSVIILFQRYKPQQLETWKNMPLFLGVLEMCFNSSDKQTSLEAHYAWNRLIFAFHLTEQTSAKVRGIAFSPLIGELKTRRSPNSHSRALGGFYNLLYYAFRPNSTWTRLDLYWDEYVAPLIKTLTPDNVDYENAGRDATDATTVLLWLFDSTTPRKWTETKAMDNLHQNQIQVNELPSLDSKWLRKNAARVHLLLSRLLDRMYWNLSDKSSAISRLWQAYITSIASPAVMEVKVAIETMMSIASTFGFLYRTWNAGPAALPPLLIAKGSSGTPPTQDFLVSFENLISITIHGLGQLSFTEKLLSIKQDTFEAVTTPSHQPKKLRNEIKSPLHHLILLLMKTSPDLHYDVRFREMVHRILTPFVEARKTNSSKMDLIKDLMSLLPSDSLSPVKLIWQVLASFAAVIADTREDKETKGMDDEPLGSYYRGLAKILEIGIRLSPNEPLPNWKILLDSIANSASIDAGDAGKATAVVEPLARALLQKSTGPDDSPTGLFYLQFLLSKATFPKDRQALDVAKKKLWGAGNTGSKLPTFDPYEKLYEYLQKSLEDSYASFSKQHVHIYADTISAITAYLNRCPSPILLGALTKSQQGLAIWITDKDGKLGGGTPLGKATITLWSSILKFTPHLLESHTHTKVLAAVEDLICSGLESKHKTIVNASINSWNNTFGISKSGFEYPEHAKAALLRLRAEADGAIELPFFPESLTSEPLIDEGQPLRFTDSQDDYGGSPGPSTLDLAALNTRDNPRPESSALLRVRKSYPQVIIDSGRAGSLKRSRENTPDQGNKSSKKRAITPPKFRHDDSQIQFEAVESSPMTDRRVDSQLLTGNQKETRERQQDEAAMFPDLRSSPRARTKSVEPELPVYRSSSKLRNTASPGAQRQATPTLVPQSDDDHCTYSSPTPTRSVREGAEVSDSASPEPEVAEKVENPDPVDEIPSSPPRASPEPADDIEELDEFPPNGYDEASEAEDDLPPRMATPKPSDNNESEMLDPSAQLDPYFLEVNQSLSSYVPTPQRDENIMSSPSAQLRASEAESELAIRASRSEIEQVAEPLAALADIELPDAPANPAAPADSNIVDEPRSSTPGTPTRTRSDSPVVEQTPRTPQFVDADTSPASSNNIFEDAVENSQNSPRLDLEHAQQVDSPMMSDLDESSMMRVMDGYDQDSERPAKQVLFIDDDEDTPHRQTQAPGATFEKGDTSTSPLRDLEQPEKFSSQQSVSTGEQEPTNPDQPSSVLSMVPETPHEKYPVLGVDDIYNDDGVLCTLENTIVVDIPPEYEGKRRPVPATKGRGSGRRKSLTPASKKRKLGEVAGDPVEVPDSQEAATDADHNHVNNHLHSPKKLIQAVQGAPTKASPAKRRRSGRFMHSIQESRESVMNNSMNQSFESVDLDASMQGSMEDESAVNLAKATNNPVDELVVNEKKVADPSLATDNPITDPNADDKVEETALDVNSEILPTIEEHPEVQEDVDMQDDVNIGRESVVKDGVSKQIAKDISVNFQIPEVQNSGAQEVEAVDETIVYETTLFDESSSEPAKASNDIEESAKGAEPHITPVAPSSPAAAVETGLEDIAMGVSTFEGVKTKLQSIITDLRSAVFGRREVNELEDMFYEAKKELCIMVEKRRSADL